MLSNMASIISWVLASERFASDNSATLAVSEAICCSLCWSRAFCVKDSIQF
jgi:hypothetical protein